MSGSKTHTPFGKIHIDLEGPTPIMSSHQFRFYGAIVDEFSKFVWVIPLKYNSKNFINFFYLKKYVKRQFDASIKIIQTDGGVEFVHQRFNKHLQEAGFVHHLSCPCTPEQNGIVERQHRVIREFGMTMMLLANVPKHFWVEAFITTRFLLNWIPIATLQWNSPFQRLYGKNFDYTSLRIFGS